MKRTHLITLCAIASALTASNAVAKLPPLSDDAKAKAADGVARAAWTDKVGLYKTCLAMDRVAEQYRRDAQRSGKQVPAPTPTAPCADPGPYGAPVTPTASKPLEASEAHSPTGNATSPPSTNATAADLEKARK